jgi:hypothetical protein
MKAFRKKISFSQIILFLPFMLSLSCCITERNPTIITKQLTNIRENSATGGGIFSEAGTSNTRTKGIIWDSTGSPYKKTSNYTENGSGLATFTDSRDGKSYPSVQIGTQCWLQKSLNYSTPNSLCYENKSTNCDKYGRLYDWMEAYVAGSWGIPKIDRLFRKMP